jgi:hypothetical protein
MLKGAKLEDPASDIWIGQVNVKNGKATDEIIREQVKITWTAD